MIEEEKDLAIKLIRFICGFFFGIIICFFCKFYWLLNISDFLPTFNHFLRIDPWSINPAIACSEITVASDIIKAAEER